MIKPVVLKYTDLSENDFIDYWLKGKIFNDQRFLVPPSRPS